VKNIKRVINTKKDEKHKKGDEKHEKHKKEKRKTDPYPLRSVSSLNTVINNFGRVETVESTNVTPRPLSPCSPERRTSVGPDATSRNSLRISLDVLQEEAEEEKMDNLKYSPHANKRNVDIPLILSSSQTSDHEYSESIVESSEEVVEEVPQRKRN